MHPSVMAFVEAAVVDEPVGPVLEVGSYVVNGSVRTLFGAAPRYVGVDVVPGPGVDVVYDGRTLPFPDDSFDLVVSTEMLEHARYPWRVVAEMARVVRPGGLVVITARGWVVTRTWEAEPGVTVGEVATFAFHNPPDLWRYSGDAMRAFAEDAGLDVVTVEQDPQAPGWFLSARRPR